MLISLIYINFKLCSDVRLTEKVFNFVKLATWNVQIRLRYIARGECLRFQDIDILKGYKNTAQLILVHPN